MYPHHPTRIALGITVRAKHGNIEGMTFKSGIEKSGDRARRTGGGGGLAIGGGIGGLLLVGLFLLLGGDPSQLNQGGGQQELPAGSSECKTSDDANKSSDCRVEFTAISVDRVWKEQLPRQAGIQYTEPGLNIFTNSTRSGCGIASSSTGPFYCPADQSAYFDVSFFDMLAKMGGSNGPLAQEYVVAHEFGHHIQKLENTLGRSNYNQPGPESDAVKIELQADCYAGFWAHYADDGEQALLETLTEDQVKQALDTAMAIGDDTIQKHQGGEVKPDLWTHGSGKQRREAFLTGYQSGSMKKCDYLGRNVYKY